MQLIEKIAPFYIVFIIVEAIYSAVKGNDVYSFRDSIADISTGAMSRLMDVLVLVIGLSMYESVRSIMGNPFGIQMDFSTPFVSIDVFPYFEIRLIPFIHWAFVFVLVDLVFYTYHRASHEINFFWASHVVHHSSEEFNYSVALRQTLFRNAFYLIFALPLAFLNVSWEALIISDALNRTYQFWTHTRLIPKLPRWYEYIFVTPSHHRVHHAVNPEYIDKNYAGFFILWDRLFGTFAEEKEEPVYGITKRLDTYNPVLANFHVYKDIFIKIFSPIKFSEKLGYAFRYPGWEPSQKERYFPPVKPRVNREDPTSLKFKILVLGSLATIFLTSLLFIRIFTEIAFYWKAIAIFGFFMLFWVLGKTLDNK